MGREAGDAIYYPPGQESAVRSICVRLGIDPKRLRVWDSHALTGTRGALVLRVKGHPRPVPDAMFEAMAAQRANVLTYYEDKSDER